MSDNKENTFANFMTPKSVENDSKNASYISNRNKTSEALKQAREDEKEEKAKELKEAKKNSIALANRYGKSDMMKLQAKNIIMMVPFIIIAALIIIILIFKGGDWLSLGLNKLFKIMTKQS